VLSSSSRTSQRVEYLAALIALVSVVWDRVPGPLSAKGLIAAVVFVIALNSRFGPAAKAQQLRNAVIDLIPSASAAIDSDARTVVELDVLDPARSTLREVCGVRGLALAVVVQAGDELRPVYTHGIASRARSEFVLPAQGRIGDVVSGSASEWFDDDLAAAATRAGQQERAQLLGRDYRSVASFPIYDRQSRVAALVALHGAPGRFGDIERSFLADIAVVISQVWAVNSLVSP
jgi:GAF domain-containing protein